jgi:hypothetical protein
MSASHRHLQRTTDQTSGAVQRQAVKPSTVGSAQRGAEATRAANAGSSRRVGPGATTEKGERLTGKALKSAIGDWVKSARATSDALNQSLKTLEAANDAGNEVVAAICEQACQMLLERCQELVLNAKDLAEIVQGEQSTDNAGQPDAEGVVETNTGEVPRESGSAGALDSAAMDAGATVVMDHVGNVSAAEPGTFQNPYVVDAARIEGSRKKAGEILGALNPERVRAGLPDEVLTDMNDPRLSWNQRAQ